MKIWSSYWDGAQVSQFIRDFMIHILGCYSINYQPFQYSYNNFISTSMCYKMNTSLSAYNRGLLLNHNAICIEFLFTHNMLNIGKHQYVFAFIFHIFSWNWDIIGYWDSPFMKTATCPYTWMLKNYDATKTSRKKPVCIFHGIYCMHHWASDHKVGL